MSLVAKVVDLCQMSHPCRMEHSCAAQHRQATCYGHGDADIKSPSPEKPGFPCHTLSNAHSTGGGEEQVRTLCITVLTLCAQPLSVLYIHVHTTQR